MFTITRKCAVAAIFGVTLWAIYFWRFLPYAIRDDRDPIFPLWVLPALTFGIAMVLTWPRGRNRLIIPVAMLAGFLVPHCVMVIVDCWHESTNHNLLPFEIAIILVMTAPAFVATGLSILLHRSHRERRMAITVEKSPYHH